MTALLLMLLAAIVTALHLLTPAPTPPVRAERPLRLTVMPFKPTPRPQRRPRPTPTVTVIDGVPVPPGAVLVTPRPPQRPTPPTPED